MGKDVIVACDFSSAEQTFAFLDKFTGRKPFVKIGMELYYAEGPEIVRQIKARGHKIFLDLKLHDIPNTVKKAMAVLRNLDVDITNLHAAGTTAMMQAALEGLTRPDGTRPLLIAVTQLTSTDQEAMERDLMIHEPMDRVVMHYAETAKNAGLDGVVCSPLEAEKVHSTCGKNFITVTPGVRFADGDAGDQKRGHDPRRRQGHRLRLHRGRPPHHRRSRPRSRLRAVRCRICGLKPLPPLKGIEDVGRLRPTDS